MGYGIPNAWAAYQMNLPAGIENTEYRIQNTDSYKVLHNGQLFIQRDGRMYAVV